MAPLTMKDDGVNAVDLGIVGSFQYAVDFMGTATAASVWRRAAAERGTYGGWRYECSSAHPCRYPGAHPGFAELSQRIGQAITVRSQN